MTRPPIHHLQDIAQPLLGAGAGPLHLQHLWRRWLQAQALDSPKRPLQGFLPKGAQDALPALLAGLQALAQLRSRHPGADGSERLLVSLADGQTVESVLLPRGGLCISTQVGCAVGCVFCMTGQGGLLRQLGSAEIVAQLVLARSLRPVKKVVFMGMGEPAHNLEAVLDAIEIMGSLGGIGHKNLVFSTVGDSRAFELLLALRAGQVRPALALSLHSTKDRVREELLPRAPRLSVATLATNAEAYARATGYPTQYQWTLIDGVNDGEDEVEGIANLLQGKYALMNLIPYNTVAGLPLRRPSTERATEMARKLMQRGILTKLRQSAGQDVDAGCGQLRARSENGAPRLSEAAARRIPIKAVAPSL